MKKSLVLLAFVALPGLMMAQKKGFDYKFYGQVRTDLFYNSRANSETVDGLFYMYPKNISPDSDGKDLNSFANGGFYTLYSRLGVEIDGPKLMGKIKTSAKLEVDFRGSGTSFSMLRMRHVYFNLDWGKSALLVGQTWHPLYGDVAPDILNLNMGAPFQPFSRAPQLRYRFTTQGFVLTASAIWQSQYLSVGPANNTPGTTATAKSQNFIKNSCVPEFYFGADYRTLGMILGAGVHVSSMTPRTQSETGNGVYKVNERITGVSGEAHVKYVKDKFSFSAKTLLSTNLTMTSTVGGYGVTYVDTRTGEQEYAPLRVSHSWVNMVYGSRLRFGVFAGYLKNLGAREEVSSLIGTGTNLDQLSSASAELTYNIPNWKFGMEYSWTGAWYGKNDSKGKVFDTNLVKNNRIVFTAMFQF